MKSKILVSAISAISALKSFDIFSLCLLTLCRSPDSGLSDSSRAFASGLCDALPGIRFPVCFRPLPALCLFPASELSVIRAGFPISPDSAEQNTPRGMPVSFSRRHQPFRPFLSVCGLSGLPLCFQSFSILPGTLPVLLPPGLPAFSTSFFPADIKMHPALMLPSSTEASID